MAQSVAGLAPGFPACAGIDLDVLVRLTARVIEVNADFLVREALPVFEAAVGGLAEMSSDS